MALTRNQRDKIINEVKKLYIKEFDESKNLRNELVDFIFDAILECLTPEEKELRELKERQKELESKLNNKNEE